jgi:hypothetical protein
MLKHVQHDNRIMWRVAEISRDGSSGRSLWARCLFAITCGATATLRTVRAICAKEKGAEAEASAPDPVTQSLARITERLPKQQQQRPKQRQRQHRQRRLRRRQQRQQRPKRQPWRRQQRPKPKQQRPKPCRQRPKRRHQRWLQPILRSCSSRPRERERQRRQQQRERSCACMVFLEQRVDHARHKTARKAYHDSRLRASINRLGARMQAIVAA